MKKQTLTQWCTDDGVELLRTADNGEFYIPLGTVTEDRLAKLRSAIDDALDDVARSLNRELK